jgi:putative ABC transport system ATP-binding protein
MPTSNCASGASKKYLRLVFASGIMESAGLQARQRGGREAKRLLNLVNVSKIYTGRMRTPALNHVNLLVERGEFLAIVGPSGSGKSTLMNIIGLLDRPTTGEYWLDGQEVSRWPDTKMAVSRNRTLGFVYQSFNLIPTLSARENVELPLVYRRVPPRERHQRATAWLTRLGLGTRLDHRPQELSGGQQQRVALARALVGAPEVLLADEPTGNLDDATTREILKLFQDINSQGQTIILITHDRTLAAVTDRVVSLVGGNLKAEAVVSYAH